MEYMARDPPADDAEIRESSRSRRISASAGSEAFHAPMPVPAQPRSPRRPATAVHEAIAAPQSRVQSPVPSRHQARSPRTRSSSPRRIRSIVTDDVEVKMMDCPTCKGTGNVRRNWRGITLWECFGTNTCDKCDGTGSLQVRQGHPDPQPSSPRRGIRGAHRHRANYAEPAIQRARFRNSAYRSGNRSSFRASPLGPEVVNAFHVEPTRTWSSAKRINASIKRDIDDLEKRVRLPKLVKILRDLGDSEAQRKAERLIEKFPSLYDPNNLDWECDAVKAYTVL